MDIVQQANGRSGCVCYNPVLLMKTEIDTWYLSHSPVRQNELRVFFKSIKDSKSIGGNIIANAFSRRSKEEAESRATLIAAAPALLKALEEIASLEVPPSIYIICKHAIAKAKGI